MLMEYFPLQDLGTAVRPVQYDEDPWGRTHWIVPKTAEAHGVVGPVRQGA